ncbi:methyltransferase family protein [Nocardiopsis sp. LOL_012]|uniref:methyltransferase family protein n=1 Tax=Nocardiopsis sp. LOL_012 TaxID=3345409 RepID=UPI003A8C588B
MALTVLLLYLAGLVLAFGVRTLLAWKHTGDTGFRRPDTTLSNPAWWGSALFAAALLLGLAAPLAAMTGLLPAPRALLHPVTAASGIAAMTAGLVLVLASQKAMGASWRVGVEEGEHTDLVTGGVFAWVRNPVFTGMGVLLVGMAAAVPTVLSLATLTAFTAAVQIQVRAVEEPHLLRTHGGAYAAYAARTGRFLPFLGRLEDDRTGT